MNDTTEYIDRLADARITLADVLAPETIEQNEHGLVISDESKAQWALAVYAAEESSLRNIDRQADLFIDRINAWREQRKRVVGWQLERFAQALHGFFLGWREKHPREKTLFLPSGKIAEHAQQPEAICDNDALVAWMEVNGLGDLVQVKKSPNWAALKKLCDLTGNHPVFLPTGEEIPAVTLSFRPPSFTITTAGDAEDRLIEAGETPPALTE